MKKIVLIFIMIFACTLYLKAEETTTIEDNTVETEKQDDIEKEQPAINLKSQSGIIMEASTKKVLLEKSSHEHLAPASMTKIMTMLLIMEELNKGNIKLEDQVIISANAANMGGSQVYLEANSKATVKELLTAIGIASANDAAVAMAEKIGGSEDNFVNMMNKRAKELGCVDTHFSNPHGLDEDDHYSSAYDMALIAAELLKYEDILEITKTHETTLTHQNGKNIWLVNTNSLIRFYSGLDGLKTGYTEKAGYCLTGTMKRNNMRLITVVMHANEKEDRNTDTINMMEYGYSMFYKNILIDKEKSIGEIFIDNSKKRTVKYYLEEDANIILGKDIDKIKYKYNIELDEVKAPLKKGDKVGKLTVIAENEEKEYNLIVKEDIEESGYFNRMFNYFKDIISGNVNVINV